MEHVNIQMNPLPRAGGQQTQPATAPEPTDYLRVVRADSNDYGTLNLLRVNSSGTDQMVISDLVGKFAPHLVWKVLNETFLFRVQSIDTGVILQVRRMSLRC